MSSSSSETESLPTRAFTADLREHPSYRPDIDGLRAVAIIPVVIFHGFPTLLPGGFIGVDIFFVISGFLISSIIFKGLERKSFKFSSFYANRIKRIFPALLVVLIASVVIGCFFLLPGEYEQLGRHVAAGAGYVENIVLWREAGYFDTRTIFKPLMHLWSLGIEEQFYLTYPFLLWAAWRLRCKMLAVLVPLICISFAINVWEVGRDAAASFFLPQTRFWELWSGGVLAYLDLFGPYACRRYADGSVGFAYRSSECEPSGAAWRVVPEVFSIGGALLIGLAPLLVRERAFPGWWALLPVGGASLLILAGPSAWINRRILSNRAAVSVGLISYPLYLWHWPLLSFGRIVRGEELPSGLRIAAVMLSFLLAWATFRFVESPIRFGRKTWLKTAALVLVSMVIGSVGYSVHSEDGFANRFKNISVDFDWAYPETESTPECREKIAPVKMDYCRSSGVGAPDVLLIGDSHAGAIYRGLAPAYGQRSEIVMNLAETGCAPFYLTETYSPGVPGRDCKPIVNRMLNFAISTPSARTIILSMRGPKYVTGLDFGEAATLPARVIAWDGAPERASQDEVFANALRNTIARLSASGKNVVLLVDWPELGFDPRTCLPRPVTLFSRVRAGCGVPRAMVDVRNHAYREIISEMKKEFGGLVVFDPLPYLCDSNACYAMQDGHLLYRDDNHLSATGSAYLAEKFLAEQDRPAPAR